jgi:signal peptidase I
MTINGTIHDTLKEVSFSLLSEGKSLRIRADGYSMFPAIRPGNIIIIDPLPDPSTLIPGDIIACRRESGFVVHRLTAIREEDDNTLFITRGDSCRQEDQPTESGKIVGIVTAIETKKGTITPTPRRIHHRLNKIIVTLIHLRRRLIRAIRHNSRNS